jgi:hypothetical protein
MEWKKSPLALEATVRGGGDSVNICSRSLDTEMYSDSEWIVFLPPLVGGILDE